MAGFGFRTVYFEWSRRVQELVHVLETVPRLYSTALTLVMFGFTIQWSDSAFGQCMFAWLLPAPGDAPGDA